MLSDRLQAFIVGVIEAASNTDGNFDDTDIGKVANTLRQIEKCEFDELQSLSYEDCITDDSDQ